MNKYLRIDLIGKSGANAFHFQMTRMRRCNIKDEGDDTHSPFIDHDPSKPLDEKVLDQWDGWLDALEAQHNVTRRDGRERIIDDGKIVPFMEQTDWHTMKPQDHLATGSTRWVLANPGHCYIAYTCDCSGPMGIRNVTAGNYSLMWFDTVTGKTVTQRSVSVTAGDAKWQKPGSLGKEIALYVKLEKQ